jgi:DtxR family Mn-dependent transcriptional regulator
MVLSKKFKKSIVSLINLKTRQKGIIASIKACGNAKRRLADMGLTPGTEIIVTKSAPFRGPIQISVRGSKLAIGRGIAMKILVKVK